MSAQWANAQAPRSEKSQGPDATCDGAALSRQAGAYYIGKGVPQDYHRAFELFQKAADCGDAYAMSSLGYMYQAGQGVKQDVPHAGELYKKSAELGDPQGTYSLGMSYNRLRGFPTDYVKARELLEKAVALGVRNAAYALGQIYEDGDGVLPDGNRAREWYEKVVTWPGAPQDDYVAQLATERLGFFYWRGFHGVPKDDKLAFQWYQKSAAIGNAAAMAELATMYREGRGVEKDPAQAKIWSDQAAKIMAKNQPPEIGPKEPDCKLPDMDLRLNIHKDSSDYVVMGLEIHNLSDKACRIDSVQPQFIFFESPPNPHPPPEVKVCYNCTAYGVSAGTTPTAVAANGFAHATFRWKNSSPDVPAQCAPFKNMNVFLQGRQWPAKFALDFTAAAPWPKVCSVVDVSSVIAGRDPYLGGYDAAKPALQLSASKESYFQGERILLRLASDDQYLLPEAGQPCPVLVMREREPSGMIHYHQLGSSVARCKAVEKIGKDASAMEITGSTYPNQGLGEYEIEFLEFASIGNEKYSWLEEASSNPLTYRILDATTIPRDWGPQAKGLALNLKLDKTTYELGEDVPLHIARGNFGASEPIAAAICPADAAAITVRDVDGQRVAPAGGHEICTGGGSSQAVAAGDVIATELSLARIGLLPRQPGIYTISATWTAYAGPPRDAHMEVTVATGPVFPYAFVNSNPITIRIVDPQHPDAGKFLPAAPWPSNFVQVDTSFGPKTALLDKTTGLRWLHLDLTAFKSYKEVRAGMAEGEPFAEWRYATADEVKKMFADFDGAPDGRSNDLKLAAVFQGALGGPLQNIGHTQCLMMAGPHPVLGGLIFQYEMPNGSGAMINPEAQGEWTPNLELTEAWMCSYLVQQDTSQK
jgi:TPR repeat protein